MVKCDCVLSQYCDCYMEEKRKNMDDRIDQKKLYDAWIKMRMESNLPFNSFDIWLAGQKAIKPKAF